jgi:hypothetical protein
MEYRSPILSLVGTTSNVVLGTGQGDPDNVGAVSGRMFGDAVAGLDE